MRHTSAAATFFAIFACICFVPATRADESASTQPANLLLNGGAEQGKDDKPSIWVAACVPAADLTMTRDTKVFHTGQASLAISNQHKYEHPTANNWAQSIQHVPAEGTSVVISGWVKSKNADAVNVCIQCWDASGRKMLGFASTPQVVGDQDWTEMNSSPLVVPTGTKSITVRAVLAGKGPVWFDDLSLHAQGPADGAP